MTAVFAYGTLRDAEYQFALFDRIVTSQPATLADRRLAFTESGYLTIVAAAGELLAGDLILLTDAELAIADGWEDVPLYTRVPVEVRVASGNLVPAVVYVRPGSATERVPDGVLARRERRDVLAQIREFRQARTKSESA